MKSKITKVLERVLPFLLTLTITVSAFLCMTVSVSADEYDSNSGWFDVLDYGTLLDGFGIDDGTFFPLTGYQPFGVELPVETTLYSVDMVLSMDGNIDLTQFNIQFVWQASGAYTSLRVIHIGENLYRAYGNVPSGNYRSFDIRFWNYDGQTYYIDVKSLRVQTVETTSFPEVGTVKLSSAGGIDEGTMRDPNTIYPAFNYSATGTTFYCSIWSDNWKKYDYIDFYVTATVDSINSITCNDGVNNYPYEIGYLDGDNGTWTSAIIRVDLSGLDRANMNYPPVVLIRGYGTGQFSVTLHSVTGHVLVDAPDQQVYWWTKLFDNIGSWFFNLGQWMSEGFQSVVDAISTFVSGSPEQQQQVADAVDKMEQSSDALGQLGDQMNSVEKPAPSDMNVSPNSMIPDTALMAYTAPITYLWQNNTLVAMLTIVVTLVLVSWVFFGKKV